jgi:SAM-dependent methyltransferase
MTMFTLDTVVLWGRSFDEYRRMFALTDEDLRGRVLGCGDGPAAFNAEATRRGARVTSCDPIYEFSADQIRERINATAEVVIEQTRRNRDEFVWTEITSVEHLHKVRMTAMEEFLADYDAGRDEGRYVAASLPSLPFGDRAFDLAICSHFLFLYSDQLGQQFHEDALLELRRVADEVRIFPLVALGGAMSPHVASTTAKMQNLKYAVTIERVPYEFQRGGNEMMRIRKRTGNTQI